MAVFLGWIARHYEELQQRLQIHTREIRCQGRGRAIHAHLPAALAELRSGLELWLEFALETGAVGTAERMDLGRDASGHSRNWPYSRLATKAPILRSILSAC
jgi:hypothetical protein